ncbi:MAG: alpha/beta hydrolase [Rubrivivax sp.]
MDPTPRTLLFAHANGFPAGSYRVLFDAWQAAGWQVLAPPMVGHDARYPVSSNWPHLRDELVDHWRIHAATRPVWLVGHSLGGFLSLLAACHQPAMACGVVLLDAPIIGGWRAHSVRVMKASGLIGRASPGKASRRRRTHWDSAAAVYAHFAAKPVFARWDPRVLHDYVDAGTLPDPDGGMRLGFDRNIETQIYDSLPHHFDALLRRHPPQCPVAFIGGRQSDEVHRVGLLQTRRVVGPRLRWLEGSHLFPMEHPDATAAAVLTELATMPAEVRQ